MRWRRLFFTSGFGGRSVRPYVRLHVDHWNLTAFGHAPVEVLDGGLGGEEKEADVQSSAQPQKCNGAYQVHLHLSSALWGTEVSATADDDDDEDEGD